MNGQAEKHGVREILDEQGVSPARKYRAMVLGDVSWTRLAMFEVYNLFFGSVPGALGLFLRRKLLRYFLKACGSNPVIGHGCTFRHPGKIALGDDVVIDEYCCLDAHGTGDRGLVVGDRVVINRLSAIRSKGGDIVIGDGVSIGSGSQLIAQTGIVVGTGAVLAGDCYLSAGTYEIGEMGKPIAERHSISGGPISIGSNAWLATRVTVLDAAEIGEGSVISAGSVVNHNIPAHSVAHGNPAEVVFKAR